MVRQLSGENSCPTTAFDRLTDAIVDIGPGIAPIDRPQEILSVNSGVHSIGEVYYFGPAISFNLPPGKGLKSRLIQKTGDHADQVCR